MSNRILYRQIINKLDALDLNNKTIVVLKGIPMKVVDESCVVEPVEKIVENKLAYFMNICSKRKFITYEEFLLLNSFILDQYEHIYVLNNNIYMNQYPLDVSYSDEVKRGLLVHFTESEDDDNDEFIGDIENIIDLYSGLKEYNGFLIGAYCESKIPKDFKIVNINLFEYQDIHIEHTAEDSAGFFEMKEESDYIEFVKLIFSEPEEVYVKCNNYTGNLDQLNEHIALLKYYWADYTDILVVQTQEQEGKFEHREEYNEILKKYWGYDKFRTFDVYDLKKLEEGEKVTTAVSQEQIISDLVQQVENTEDGEIDCRDVFVTAPTGAGKSVIFQIPAIYLAEKYNLLTIVISPLIGLMNDQVLNLEKRDYSGAKTINSDISPVIKEEILEKVADGEYHILYLSPETLLARSTIEQLIGDRTIGMIIVDEAHIVTTWGKQFRPDYWYLGEHIRKLRSNQLKKKGRSFIIGTFTATAIYKGFEDMYEETKNSLQLRDPITYLGYIKRNDIRVNIDNSKKPSGERAEYDKDKQDQLLKVVQRALITGRKMLVYFPTVSLINESFQWIENKNKHITTNIAIYHGQLSKDLKNENYQSFYAGEKQIMFATKAFGMGIDIDDIELVVHYAPTGNVCDYVQEIGRAARRKGLEGEAYYQYNPKDFKYINRLHGLSSIKKYQIVEVVKKINELYRINRYRSVERNTKKKNAMLVDAENFTYIFDNPLNEGDDSINKVKTALLIIQKDFEAKIGFSPITVRPIPLFSLGFFSISPATQRRLKERYKNSLEEINKENNICRVNLEKIWQKDFKDKSFPQFKYLLYSNDKELSFNQKYTVQPALCVQISFLDDYKSTFRIILGCLKKIINDAVITQEFIPEDNFIENLMGKCGFKKYKASTICDVFLASMEIYAKKYLKGANAMFQKRPTKNGKSIYQFKTAINTFFRWLENGMDNIEHETKESILYIIDSTGKKAKETSTILGLLESWDVLTFEMTGGANSQLYIYVNQVRDLQSIEENPGRYENRLLEMVSQRHTLSVKMLTYIYENNFTNEQIWDILEDYFLGKIPERVKQNCIRENPKMNLD